MTDRRCPYCLLPECPRCVRDRDGMIGFAYGVASSAVVVVLALLVRWLFTYVS